MSELQVVVEWSDEDEAYVALVPGLPGLAAHGDTPEQAEAEARSAARSMLEVAGS